MVWSPRHVFGRAGWGMEENHERRSREAWIHVLPTLAHRACLACGLDERHNPCQLFGQPRVLAGSNDKRVYASDRKSTRLNSSHTEIYTLSLHDALPISQGVPRMWTRRTAQPLSALRSTQSIGRIQR